MLHLEPTLGEVPLLELAALARPKLLSRLKDAGVGKLGDRQGHCEALETQDVRQEC
jgi:hypothetical protein